MRLSITCLLVLLAAAVPFARSEGYAGVPGELLFKSDSRRYGHLEYVGFYGSALQHWNFTEELAGVTNLTWIELRSIDETVERVREAAENGVEAVISLQLIVFEADSTIKPGYLAALQELQEKLESAELIRHIAMLYPIDEPYLRAANSESTNRQQIYLDMLALNREIREIFPDIPLGVIFNNKEVVRRDFKIPPSYRWVGFDCYDNMFDCKKQPFTEYYSTLLAQMTPKQNLMAVPQAWVRYRDYEQGRFEPNEIYAKRLEVMVSDLQKRLQHHYEVALSEPRMIAFIPFIWSMEAAPGKPPHSGFGADRFEEQFPQGGTAFVNQLLDTVEAIKRASSEYPNLAREETEQSLYRGPNDYDGEILDIAPNGLVSAWAVNWLLPHKSLRMELLVHRKGEEIYASGLERSFILDPEITDPAKRNLPVLGVHGYRHKLPGTLIRELMGTSAVIKIRIYGDGENQRLYHELREKHFF